MPYATLGFILVSMLKSCPSCSYIGNDGEHVCPFCKADLAMGLPGTRPRLGEGTSSALRSSKQIRSARRVSGLFACHRTRESVALEFSPFAHGLRSESRKFLY
jgi:hypothetical protein